MIKSLSVIQNLLEDIWKEVDKIIFESTNDRRRIAGGLFYIAILHSSAIIELLRIGNYASSYALGRSMIESYGRGLWLLYCATEDELELFKDDSLKHINNPIPLNEISEHMERKIKKGLRISFGNPIPLITIVEHLQAWEFRLTDLLIPKDGSPVWATINSYTHSGAQLVNRVLTDRTVEQSFKDGELEDYVKSTGLIALLSFNQTIEISTLRANDKIELIKPFVERWTKLYPNKQENMEARN